MHLESLAAQRVRIPVLDLELHFADGERIHTENSYKFTIAQLVAMLEEAGFSLLQQWSDPKEWFGVYLAAAV